MRIAGALVLWVALAGVAEAQPRGAEIARAEQLAAAGQHEEAALLLTRILEGDIVADAPAIQQAQVLFARELGVVGFRQSALAVVDEIVQHGPAHPGRRQVLPILAALALVMPRASGVTRITGEYQDAEITAAPGLDDVGRARLRWLLGRNLLEQGRFEDAIALLAVIPERTPYFVQAQMLTAALHVRMRHQNAAARSLRRVIDHLGPAPPTARRRNAREVAWMTLARLHYGHGRTRSDSRALAIAAAMYEAIPAASAQHGRARIELAWTAYAAGATDRAMRVLASVPPDAADRDGEVAYLRAVLAVEQCRMADARAAIAEQRQAADAAQRDADAWLAANADEGEAALRAVRGLEAIGGGGSGGGGGGAAAPVGIRLALLAIASDPVVRAQLRYVALLEREEQKLAVMPPAFRGSSLGARIEQDIMVAKAFAVDNLRDLLRMRLLRHVDELQGTSQDLAALARQPPRCP